MDKNRKAIRSIAKMAMLLALLIVSSYISINTGVLKFTLQLLVIFIIGLCSTMLESVIIVSLYIILGVLGLPIFANFGGGFAYLLSPTFGFVYSFLIGVMVMQVIKNAFRKIQKYKILEYTLMCLACLFVVYLIGLIHFYFVYNYYLDKSSTFGNAIMLTVVPYIPFDILKIVVAIITKLTIDKIYEHKVSKVQ